MSDQASVRSFDAIERVREELLRFAHRSNEGLVEIEAEVRRVLDWIEHDRPGYWKERVRRAHDGVTEAKSALHRCLMYPINDEQPSCAEERAALKKAQAMFQEAEAKQRRVREWAQTLRHELHEYHGRVSQLRQVIDLDTPRGAERLVRLLDTLQKYTAVPNRPRQNPSSKPPSSQEGAPHESDEPSTPETEP